MWHWSLTYGSDQSPQAGSRTGVRLDCPDPSKINNSGEMWSESVAIDGSSSSIGRTKGVSALRTVASVSRTPNMGDRA